MSEMFDEGELEEENCQKPCDPSIGCGWCADYWARMEREGYWNTAKHEWTAKGMREMTKRR